MLYPAACGPATLISLVLIAYQATRSASAPPGAADDLQSSRALLIPEQLEQLGNGEEITPVSQLVSREVQDYLETPGNSNSKLRRYFPNGQPLDPSVGERLTALLLCQNCDGPLLLGYLEQVRQLHDLPLVVPGSPGRPELRLSEDERRIVFRETLEGPRGSARGVSAWLGAELWVRVLLHTKFSPELPLLVLAGLAGWHHLRSGLAAPKLRQQGREQQHGAIENPPRFDVGAILALSVAQVVQMRGIRLLRATATGPARWEAAVTRAAIEQLRALEESPDLPKLGLRFVQGNGRDRRDRRDHRDHTDHTDSAAGAFTGAKLEKASVQSVRESLLQLIKRLIAEQDAESRGWLVPEEYAATMCAFPWLVRLQEFVKHTVEDQRQQRWPFAFTFAWPKRLPPKPRSSAAVLQLLGAEAAFAFISAAYVSALDDPVEALQGLEPVPTALLGAPVPDFPPATVVATSRWFESRAGEILFDAATGRRSVAEQAQLALALTAFSPSHGRYEGYAFAVRNNLDWLAHDW